MTGLLGLLFYPGTLTSTVKTLVANQNTFRYVYRFYAAELYLAINFLHRNSIIHRDLKLENILLDAEGHIKLTDFGVSKLGISRKEVTGTRVGTPGYQAPEVIRVMRGAEGGYTMAADWWSYGVIVFEV